MWNKEKIFLRRELVSLNFLGKCISNMQNGYMVNIFFSLAAFLLSAIAFWYEMKDETEIIKTRTSVKTLSSSH